MSNATNIKLQEIRVANGSSYLRYKARDGKYRYLNPLEMPETDITGVTYSELIGMRDNALLEMGALYRITDYMTTTTQEDTRSAGHQFDVVVLATGTKTLSEQAWAMPHSGDTYFNASNLKAWRLLYSLENDTSRFSWADPENGKGVIYRLIDEWGNDCPYDFKNIQFKRWAVSSLTDAKLDSDSLEELAAQFVYDADDNPFCFARQDSNYTSGSTSFVVNDEVSEWYYTFSVFDEEGAVNDYSLRVYDYYVEGAMAVAQGNVMLPAQAGDDDDVYHYVLNNNVIIDKYDEDNEWYTVSYGNTFKENSVNNTCGANFYNNTCGANFTDNTIGASFSRNTVGAYFTGNTCGASFFGNSIGAGFNSNSCGAGFSRNTVGAYFQYNSCGAYFRNNTCGAIFQNNSIGAYFQSNSCGAEFYNNTCGAWFSNNSCGANVSSFKVLKDYTRFIIVESGNVGITLTSTQTTSQASQLQNIHIALGTNMSGSKTISHNTVGDTFKTTYQNTNSDVVDV